MRAVQIDSDTDPMVSFVERPEPEARPDEAIVRVVAASINYGDIGYLQPGAAVVKIGGYDGSGVVLQAAADGSGPRAGSKVAFLTPNGTWAERCAVLASDLAAIPDSVSFVDAAGLPAAGLTALGALDEVSTLDGADVLVIGATSGVGQLAVQLAAHRGATVTAVVRDTGSTGRLFGFGATTLVSAEDDWTFGVDVVVDLVGGPLLDRGLLRLRPGAHVLSVGNASHQPNAVDFEQLRRSAPGARLIAYTRTDTTAPDLERLLGLVERRELVVPVGWVGDWSRVAEALRAVSDRSAVGKAVLEIAAA